MVTGVGTWGSIQVEYASELPSVEGGRLGHLSTEMHFLLVEICNSGALLPPYFRLPLAGPKASKWRDAGSSVEEDCTAQLTSEVASASKCLLQKFPFLLLPNLLSAFFY